MVMVPINKLFARFSLVSSKKGSINLAINTIVMILIGIVILTLGILLMRQFISGAQEIQEGLDSQTEAELQRLLVDQGKKVALPLHTVSLEAGENHVFGLGILNLEAASYGDEFLLDVTFSKLLSSDNEEISIDSSIPESWLLFDEGPFFIEENGYKFESIYVEVVVDAKKGTYIYNAYVYDGYSERYDSVKKIYVTVE
jgi:hypothetical protein